MLWEAVQLLTDFCYILYRFEVFGCCLRVFTLLLALML